MQSNKHESQHNLFRFFSNSTALQEEVWPAAAKGPHGPPAGKDYFRQSGSEDVTLAIVAPKPFAQW